MFCAKILTNDTKGNVTKKSFELSMRTCLGVHNSLCHEPESKLGSRTLCSA